jgi:hypothetical protein
MILVLMNAQSKPRAALLHPGRRFAAVCLDQASNIADALAFGNDPRLSENPGGQLRNCRHSFSELLTAWFYLSVGENTINANGKKGSPERGASLWNVEDSSTAQLMASFYKNLKTMTKVDALRQAQLQLIQGKTNSDLLARRGIGGVGKLGETPSSVPQAPGSVSTSHPYFWAPFILVGDGK